MPSATRLRRPDRLARPTESHIKNSNLKRFMDRHAIGSYDELMRRSTDDFAWFWMTC